MLFLLFQRLHDERYLADARGAAGPDRALGDAPRRAPMPIRRTTGRLGTAGELHGLGQRDLTEGDFLAVQHPSGRRLTAHIPQLKFGKARTIVAGGMRLEHHGIANAWHAAS